VKSRAKPRFWAAYREIAWFWIGTHAADDRLLEDMSLRSCRPNAGGEPPRRGAVGSSAQLYGRPRFSRACLRLLANHVERFRVKAMIASTYASGCVAWGICPAPGNVTTATLGSTSASLLTTGAKVGGL